MSWLFTGGTVCLFGLQGIGAALAADGDAQPQASGLEEIVVTARKAKESLLDVPVTVSVVTAATMQNHDVTDLNKLSELVPQVMVGQVTSGTGALLSIRGIGSSPLDAGIDQSVSVDIDGTQISRGRVITQSLFDLQQAEILEGPQALFFGKNSPAGVIALRSADPTNTFEGYTDGGYEFMAREWFADGAISGPISDTLSARLAFRADGMRGWIDRTSEPIADPLLGGVTAPGAQGQQPGAHDYAVRLSAKWTPGEDFDAMLKILVDQQTMNSGGSYSQTFCGPGETSYQDFGVVDPYGNCNRNRMATAGSALPAQYAINLPFGNNGVPYQLGQDVVSSLNLNKRVEDFTLTSTTGFYWYTVQDSNASDYSSYTPDASVDGSQERPESTAFPCRTIRCAGSHRGSQRQPLAAGYFLSRNSSAEDDLHGGFQGGAIGLVEPAEGFRSLAACQCCTMTSPNAAGERTWLVIAIKIRSGRSVL